MAAIGAAMAQPAGGTVVAGQASISNTGATTLITQSTPKAIINWQDFSVPGGQTVQFAQPGSSSITLNRVTGSTASAINGSLLANGQVWILNSNGVLFGQGSSINVGGLLATTSDIANNDFLSGNYSFTGGNGTIVNNGTIQAKRGGSVVLSAPTVANHGLIKATAGHVVLAGTDTFTVDFNGDHLLSYAVGASTKTGSVTNSGVIKAAGGQVLMTARAASGVADGVINNTGMVEATSVRKGENGEIILDAGDGTAETSGTLDASGKKSGETGGTVDVLGQTVAVADNAKIDVSGDAGGGTALIGGNFKGAGPQANAVTTTVGKATIKADAINSGNGGKVAIYSTGTTTVAANVSAKGSAGGAGGEIETSGHFLNFDGSTINAGVGGSWLLDPYDLTVDSTAATTINASLGGGTSVTLQTTASGASGPGLQNASGNGDILINAPLSWAGSATLTLSAYRNIQFNANVTVQTSGGVVISPATGGSGDYFFGPGYSLSFSTLTAAPTLQIYSTSYTLAANIGQLASDIAGNTGGSFALANNYDASADGTYSAAPIATTFSGIFTGLGHSIANLTINTSGSTVGLFGTVNGTVRDLILSNASVSASAYVGALVGDAASGSTFQSDSSSGTVTGTGSGGYTGGLAGENFGTVINDFSTATVVGGAGSYVGGLVGYNTGAILRSFASGAVSGGGSGGCCIGGLTGQNNSGGTITDSYATGAVSANGNQYAGGLVGHNNGGAIYTSYATGTVSNATGNAGALVGSNSGTVSGSYFDTDTYATDNGGATGLTTAQLTSALPSGFDGQWANVGNKTTPYLLQNQAGSVFAGSSAATRYSVIFNMAQIQAINGDLLVSDSSTTLAGNYVLANSIDASGTSGWTPIGVNSSGAALNSGNGFTGIFDGLSQAISNLTIIAPTVNNQGLFGYSSGTIRNLGMVGGSVTGSFYVGGLVGTNTGTISNAYSSSPVSGTYAVGGLVGYSTGGSSTISTSFATGTVTGTSTNIGGLVGQNDNTLTNVYATGAVRGTGTATDVGGLAGTNVGTITNAYATGAVSGGSAVGGVSGYAGGTITNGYWNTQTSGQASSPGGGTGQTTAQLQGTLPSGFSSSIWGTGSGLYPYLLWKYPTTPQVVSGIAYTDRGVTPLASGAGGSVTVAGLANGVSLGTTTTGANGYYYMTAAAGTISASNGQVLTYVTTGGTGNTFIDNANGSVTNAPIFGNTLLVQSKGSALSALETDLATARGTAAGGNFLYTGPLTLNSGVNFEVDSTVAITVDTALTTSGGSVTLDANTGGAGGYVNIGSAIATGGGAITIGGGATPLTMPAVGTSVIHDGVTIGAALSSGGGPISIYGAGFSNGGIGVNVAQSVSAAGGSIAITGTGGAGTSASNYGINQAANITTTGTGSIILNGTGGGTGSGETGYYGSGNVTTGTGNISIAGMASATSADTLSYGIELPGTSQISTGGNGTITLTGTATGAGGNSTAAGIGMDNSVTISAANGLISLTGVNNSIGTGINLGVQTDAQITSAGTGGITFNGTGGGSSTSSTSSGVAFEAAGNTVVTGSGAITITGQGGNSGGTGHNNYGVEIDSAISAVGGAISITGTGGASAGNSNHGIYVGAAVANASGGAITMMGTGGGTGVSAQNYGVDIAGVISGGLGAVSITGTGGASTGGSDYGIYQTATVSNYNSSTGGSITLSGTGGGNSNSDNSGYYTSANVTAGGAGTGGNIIITGTAASTATGNGITIDSNAAVSTTGTGTITLNGTASGVAGTVVGVVISGAIGSVDGLITVTGVNNATSAGNHNDGVQINTGTVTSTGAGGVSISGTAGGTGAGGSNYGVDLGVTNAAHATGTGAITITGTGGGTGGTSSNNYGIYVEGAVSGSGTGAISLTGTGGNSIGGNNYGIYQAAAVSNYTSGQGSDITIMANGGGTGTGAVGYYTAANVTAGDVSASTNGNILISGAAATGAANGAGIDILNTATITTGGAGTITLTGTAAGTATFAYGLYNAGTISAVDGNISLNGINNNTSADASNYGTVNYGSITSSGAGTIAVSGTAGGAGAGGSNSGVYLPNGSTLQANGSGGITILGHGGTGTGDANYGVDIEAPINAAGGAIDITGYGGVSTGNGNTGIQVNSGIGNTSQGTIALLGHGGGTFSSSSNYGVDIEAQLMSSGGEISVTGTGGANVGDNNYGIYQAAPINSYSNSGTGGLVAINGTGNGTGNNEIGYYTVAGIIAGDPQASSNGNIIITGAASLGATGSGSHGIEIGPGPTIATYGSGTITLTGTAEGGTGGSTNGVWLNTAATLSTVDGLITVTGTNENIGSGTLNNGIQDDGTITSSGKGGITLTGTGGGFGSSNYGVYLSTTTAVQGPGSGSISITGTGGDFSQSSSGNIGVYVAQNLNVPSDIAITGTAGGTGDNTNPGISIDGSITSGGTMTLNSPFFVAAAGGLSASSLDLEGNGTFMLNNGSNNVVANLYGNVVSLIYSQIGDLVIGSSDASFGLNSQSFVHLYVTGKVTQTFGIVVGGDLSVTTAGTGNGIALDDQGFGNDPGNTVMGTARFNSTADVNYATVGSNTDTIGSSTVAGNLYVNVAGPLMLADTVGAVAVTGSTDLTGSSIGQTIPLQTQALQLYSSDGDTVMTNAGNQVTDIVNITAQSDGLANATFVNSGPTILGNSDVGGTLTVIATGANATLTLNDTESYQIDAGDIIFQAGAGITQALYGPSLNTGSLTAGAASGAITLNNGNNTVSGLVRFNTQSGDVAFNNSTTVQLGASSVTGNLTVAAFGTDGGDAQILIADPSGGAVHVTGNTALSADTDIVQGQSYDANTATLDVTNAIALQTGALDVRNGGAIELFFPTNAITGAITLATNSDPDIYNSGNTILGATNVLGDLDVQSGGSLTITGAVTANYGAVTLAANGGDLTLASGASITSLYESGNTILLAASGNFINNSGSTALNAGSGNSWNIYSAGPAADIFSGLDSGNAAIWNTDLVQSNPLSVTGNRYIFAYQPLLTVAANNVSKTYGTDASAALAGRFTVLGVQPGVAGAFLGDTPSAVYTGTATLASAGTGASANVGNYAITLNAANITAMDGYALAGSSGGSVTVNPATLTYTANGASQIYGAVNSALSGTVTGFVNGDTQAGATTGMLAFTSPATAVSNVGSYAINGSGLSATNYVFVQAAANATALSVNPATLTYVSDAASRIYGAANPSFSGTVTGFVNGDTLASATSGTLVFGAAAVTGSKAGFNPSTGQTVITSTVLQQAATAASGVGTYAIYGSGLSAGNYVFVQAAANTKALTINPATLTYLANAANRSYGQANGVLSGSVTGFVNGDTLTSATTGTLAFTSPATAGSDVGSYAINGAGLAAGNYNFIQAATNASALTINPALLTLALTGNVSKTFDGSNAATLSQSNYTALNGIFGTDNVSLANYPASGTYDSAAIGTGKTVTVSGLSLTGSKAANYIIANTLSGAVGVINAAVTTTTTVLNATTAAILKGFTTAIAAATPSSTTPTTPQATTIGATPITAITAAFQSNATTLASGGTQSSDPPTSSDAATSSVAQSLDGGPAPNVGSDAGGVVIPHFLTAHVAAPAAPLNPGALPSWGNAGLWQ